MFSSKDAVSRLKQEGHRMTPQRQAIFELLEANSGKQHPSADDLYEGLKRTDPSISKATVYNTLKALAEIGEIREIRLSSRERRFELNLDGHDHAICRKCGSVTDIHADVTPEGSPLPGFTVDRWNVTFYGVCALCKARTKKRKARS